MLLDNFLPVVCAIISYTFSPFETAIVILTFKQLLTVNCVALFSFVSGAATKLALLA